MNDNNATLLEMFSNWMPDGKLRPVLDGAAVLGATVDKKNRTVELNVSFSSPVSGELIAKISRDLAEAYNLSRVIINQKPGKGLTDQDIAGFVTKELTEVFPPAAGMLPDAAWLHTGEVLKIVLRNSGADTLSRYSDRIEKSVLERFGVAVRVRFEDDDTLDDTRRIEEANKKREELLRSIAKTKPKAEVKARGREPGKKQIFGRAGRAKPMEIKDLNLNLGTVSVSGEVFDVEHRELTKRNAVVVSFDITDYTGSIRVSKFMEQADARPIVEKIRPGMYVTIQGKVNFNRFDNDMVLEPLSIAESEKKEREDSASEKRVELHLHTRMSAMDALTDTAEAVERAAKWGHPAIAITDHGVAQSFPDAMKAGQKHKIKIIYGVEAYYINDVDDRIVVQGGKSVSLDGEFVAFDIETTGLSPRDDAITEIGAVLFKNGKPGKTFQTFVNPGRHIPEKITTLTGITDEMLVGAPSISQALDAFLEFVGGRTLAAHNAEFDMSFIAEACRKTGKSFTQSSIDTLVLAQNLLPGLGKYRLNNVADHLGLPEFNHHRAVDDAMTVAHMLTRFFAMLRKMGISETGRINQKMLGLRGEGTAKRMPRHVIILAANQTGLRNLYELISLAHLKHFKRYPIIPKSVLSDLREGLIIGSACENGELFSAVVAGRPWNELKRLASYYDYLEIQPLCNNDFMINNGTVRSPENLKEFNRSIVRLGRELGKPVVATGDVHFLDPEDEIYRRILLAGKKFEDADRSLPLYFKTTGELLEEFSYLGEEAAYEVVVKNSNLIAGMCEQIRPLPSGLFAPRLEGSAEELKSLVYEKMRRLYGENPPDEVISRVETELGDIISCSYDVIYMSAQKLVARSMENGYMVGSRGSVGSSIVAYLSGITEVNSLPPHYRCPDCKHSDFTVGTKYGCGADMPDENCPVCGAKYEKDGFNIPFATFLGFGGDKIPDIDLNFSGEYQARAHGHTIEMFGENSVFRAGTIGTIAQKTAYGYVKNYLEERGMTVTKAEENRLAKGCVGVKRTTGQHPGGLVVIPKDNEIYNFCPIQHPADDTGTDIITTHFEYHSMEENLLKLDLLGHDDPTMIKMLGDLTGVDPMTIPLDDPDTMRLFTSSEAIGIKDDPILGKTGACAIPEFGTRFVREMLVDTKPTKLDTLIRICGFAHGTDVWVNNAKDLILSGTASVDDVIGARDDIMLYLISMGLEDKLSFKIMESVRKGRGLKPEWEREMSAAGVPQWYINSCNKLKYLFPKAHAVAYVIMSFRVAWFKVHHPLAFYSAYFTIRANAFDASVMTVGIDAVKAKMKEIESNREATAVEKDMLITLEVCYEFYLRGFRFDRIDLYKSDAVKYLITENGLLPPFVAIPGLGETAARDLAAQRKKRRFVSVDELSSCCPKVSKTHIEQLKKLGALGDLPESSQLTLF